MPADVLTPTMEWMDGLWDGAMRQRCRELRFDDDAIRVVFKGSRHGAEWPYPQCFICPCGICARICAERRMVPVGYFDKRDGSYIDRMVCIGCYSRLKRFDDRIRDAEENKTIINRLQRFARHAETKYDRLFASRALEDLGRRDGGPD